MSIDAIVTMVVLLVGLWGGFALLIAGVLRKDRDGFADLSKKSDY